MQSEIWLANGEKVRVALSVPDAQEALSRDKAGVSGLVPLRDATGRDVLVNPALVTHVKSLGGDKPLRETV